MAARDARTTPDSPWRTRGEAVLAGALFLAVALWTMAPLAGAHSTGALLPLPQRPPRTHPVIEADQRFVSGTVARNARMLLEAPTSLGGRGSCYPLSRPFTLGEHLFGESVLGALPYLLTRSPFATSNAVVLFALWIPAVSMYALARHFTGSSSAGFVAGLIFAFHPLRVMNPVHPMVHGNLWTPLALLFAHRLFTQRRWRDAAGLALFLSLQLLESFYQVIGLTVLGGVYGLALLVRYHVAVPRLLPKLAAVAVCCAVVVWLVLVPYLETKVAWDVLASRKAPRMNLPAAFLPGGRVGIGWLPLALMGFGLADRVRGARGSKGDDPRLAFAAAGVLALWSSVYALPVPFTRLSLESPLLLLRGIVPGLDAVRVPGAVRFNVYLVVALLAGYGVVALTARLGRIARTLACAVLAGAVLIEIFSPRFSRAGYGSTVELETRRLAPSEEVVELYRHIPRGAVLDLPFRADFPRSLRLMSEYVLLGAYHGQPFAACYNSFGTPLLREIADLARRLPDAAAVTELQALGFRSLVLHEDLASADEQRQIDRILADPSLDPSVVRAGGKHLIVLSSPGPIREGFDTIAAEEAPQEPFPVRPPRARIEMAFANPTTATYRHSSPIQPTRLVARWRDRRGRVVRAEPTRLLLPLALAPGAHVARAIDVGVPNLPGRYLLELSPESHPGLVLSRRLIEVAARPNHAS